MKTRPKTPSPPENLPLFQEDLLSRSRNPLFFEALAHEKGYSLVAGVDEVGRGPLAGPVVAAAVILRPGAELPGVKDSKKMTALAREDAFERIRASAYACSVGVVSHHYIDEFNILNATLHAMERAVMSLERRPDFLLVDGIHAVPVPIHQRCLKKGDQLSQSISAASVVAKVYRDRILKCYHRTYPVYGFDKHKGYGTRKHLEALKLYGPCPIHRLTFKGVVST